MFYRFLADGLVAIHFAWILFMLYGFALTIRAFWRPKFFERWLFRSVHLAGILFVAALEVFGKYCPLTIWENALRRHYDPEHAYPGSFIIQYIVGLIYPNVDAIVLLIPTASIALFTLVVFVLRPPKRIRHLWPRRLE